MSDAVDAFLAAGKRPRREIAIILHRVPAVLDAAHLGSVFTYVSGTRHCDARACMALAFQRDGPTPPARGGDLEAGAFGTRSRTRPIWIGYYACRRQQSCQYEGTGDFGRSPIFVQLPDKPLLASVSLLGVLERKAQWPIEKLLR
jgi:hypothetical protein